MEIGRYNYETRSLIRKSPGAFLGNSEIGRFCFRWYNKIMNKNLGKIEKIPLREVWKNEARDFNTWLYENLDVLNEALDTNFSAVDKDKKVGSFILDIMAEDSDGNLVIVENQLNKTDHDHLGKLITYLSNMEAKTAIWITSNPREEHLKAVNWLNEFTPEGVSFLLIRVEAIKISNSPPAPLFTIVAEPTETTKKIGEEKKRYSERHYLRKEFWTQLLEKAGEKTKLHANVSPSIYSWVGAGAGKSGIGFNYVIINKSSSVELYLDKGKEYPDLNKERFDKLKEHKREIEHNFGEELSWERLDSKRACRIAYRIKDKGLKDEDKWSQLQDEMIDIMIRLEKALKPFIRKLKK